MIQEMEAWFLSQPDVIEKLYGKGTADKLVNKRAQLYEEPSRVLMNLTKNTKRGRYSKVKDAVDFLELLNPRKLEEDFPQFKSLIRKLKA